MGTPGAADTPGVPVSSAPISRREEGFTIIEVMVAILILLVGVLGTVALAENGLSSTSRTGAREGATNLARDVVERSRQIAYTSMTASGGPAQLQAATPDAGALNGSSFPVTRRTTVYTVTVTVCSIDDPSDGVGVGDASFCNAPSGPTGPGTAGTGYAASVNVLGVTVTAGGSLLSTVCNVVGTNSAIVNRLTGVVSNVVPVSACPTGTGPTAPYDSRPDDLRRVRVDVAWTPHSGTAQAISQTVLLTNPLPNDCPLVTPVAPATLPAGCPTPTS
jgi:prepilin-type N-terminal cleavage/methylation domain-containing protein